MGLEFDKANVKAQHLDECTGGVLDPVLMRAAMIESLSDFDDKEMWKAAKNGTMRATNDQTFAGTR